MERRRFAREYKLEAVRLIRDRAVSYAQASADLGVHPTQLRHWVKAFAEDPQHAFPGAGQMKPEQLEITRLKREVIKLKAERDILKTYGPPRPQGCCPDGVIGLHQRIRSQGRALAKMDIRASRVLIKASASSAAFRTRISSPPV